MRTTFYFLLAAVLLVACESKEEKAEKLIKMELTKVVTNMDSYEPVETIVDSAFSPMMTPGMFKLIETVPEDLDAYTDLQTQATALTLSSVFDPSPDKQIMLEAVLKYIEEMRNDFIALNDSIEGLRQQQPVFSGYIAQHQFRYVKEEGDSISSRYLFLLDKDLKTVEAMIDMKDEDVKTLFEMPELSNLVNKYKK